MFKKAANYFQNTIFLTSNVCRVIGAGLLIFLIILTVSDVVLRRFFNSPIPGTLEIISLGLTVIVFLSLAHCAVHDGHVVVDVIFMHFPRRIQSGVGAIMFLLSAGMCGLLCWQLILQALIVLDMNRVSAILRLWLYPFLLVAAFGSALLALVFLIKFVQVCAGGHKQ